MNQIEQRLASFLSSHWRLLLLRGLAAIVFGVLTWAQPRISGGEPRLLDVLRF